MKADEKMTLKTIKTTLNPEIKLIVLAISLGLDSASRGELPIIHKYDGISGNTQGDKKDSAPAPNAIKTDIFSAMLYITLSVTLRQRAPPLTLSSFSVTFYSTYLTGVVACFG